MKKWWQLYDVVFNKQQCKCEHVRSDCSPPSLFLLSVGPCTDVVFSHEMTQYWKWSHLSVDKIIVHNDKIDYTDKTTIYNEYDKILNDSAQWWKYCTLYTIVTMSMKYMTTEMVRLAKPKVKLNSFCLWIHVPKPVSNETAWFTSCLGLESQSFILTDLPLSYPISSFCFFAICCFFHFCCLSALWTSSLAFFFFNNKGITFTSTSFSPLTPF